jgi:peptidyl-prolyl cis-trans isomerase B (cyclophilin B)
MKTITSLLLVSLLLNTACSSDKDKRTKVEITTNYGVIVLELYNETPKHRDNFIKIINDGVLDSLLFHRVIENFMVQAGDIKSKNAFPTDTLGSNDLPYLVDAEIDTSLFHKKGALGAARDNNPARASSSTQFYIVQGKVLTDSLLTRAETRINGWLAENFVLNLPENKALSEAYNTSMKEENWELFSALNDSVKQLAAMADYPTYRIPEAHRIVYKTIGGTPHLDQNYTVFGEVVSGMEIIDAIAAVQTGLFDRPVEDVRMLKIKILD